MRRIRWFLILSSIGQFPSRFLTVSPVHDFFQRTCQAMLSLIALTRSGTKLLGTPLAAYKYGTSSIGRWSPHQPVPSLSLLHHTTYLLYSLPTHSSKTMEGLLMKAMQAVSGGSDNGGNGGFKSPPNSFNQVCTPKTPKKCSSIYRLYSLVIHFSSLPFDSHSAACRRVTAKNCSASCRRRRSTPQATPSASRRRAESTVSLARS